SPEALAVDVVDRTTYIDHAVYGMNSHRRQPAAGRFFAMGAPVRGFKTQCIWECHCRSNVHHRTQPAGPDALAKFRHFRMKTAVVSKTERNSRLASSLDGAFCVALRQSKRLLAEDVFSSLCRSDHLLCMHRMRS